MAGTVMELTADTWTKVLTNVTTSGLVGIIEQVDDPGHYEVAWVDTGAAAPSVGYEGGIYFTDVFQPGNSVAQDYYVRPKGSPGKVVVYT